MDGRAVDGREVDGRAVDGRAGDPDEYQCKIIPLRPLVISLPGHII